MQTKKGTFSTPDSRKQFTRLTGILAWGGFLSGAGILPDWLNLHSLLELPYNGWTPNGRLPDGHEWDARQRNLI
jgi:hypothetical protein